MDIESVITSNASLIHAMACVCLKKMNKPTIWTVDDLVQEGRLRLCKSLPSYDSTKNLSIPSYCFMQLRNRYAALMRQSYQKKIKYGPDEVPASGRIVDVVPEIIFSEKIEMLGEQEKDYIVHLLSGDNRILTRKLMGLNKNQENKIMHCIDEVLQK